MNVLIGCEESQEVCKAFRSKGHNAFSCDLEPCSGGHPEWHIQDDVRNVLRHDIISPFSCKYDMVIGFPPCDYLTVSNNNAMTYGCKKYTKAQGAEYRKKAIQFFEFFTILKNFYVAIENPIGVMNTIYRKPDQIIQPYQFGHGETKKTCLWLKNLPLLKPTNEVSGREQNIWKMPPSADRKRLRSKTFPGIAQAMANQWNFK